MLDKFIVFITNSLYFVSASVKKFRKKFPEANILIACATKGRKLQGDEDPQYDSGWSSARRNTLILTDSGLYCGDLGNSAQYHSRSESVENFIRGCFENNNI